MRFPFSLGAGVLLLLTALPAMGQERARQGVNGAAARRVSDVLNATVTQDGRQLGRVRDMNFSDNGAIQDLIVGTANGLVVVPFSSVRYDSGKRVYAITAGVAPRPFSEARPASQAAVAETDPWAGRAGRLVRTEPPPPPTARIERVPVPPVYVAPDPASARRLDFAWAANRFGEPVSSVSLTRNIDRLPARSPAFDNYTLPSEAYGRRSGFPLPPPPAGALWR